MTECLLISFLSWLHWFNSRVNCSECLPLLLSLTLSSPSCQSPMILSFLPRSDAPVSFSLRLCVTASSVCLRCFASLSIHVAVQSHSSADVSYTSVDVNIHPHTVNGQTFSLPHCLICCALMERLYWHGAQTCLIANLYISLYAASLLSLSRHSAYAIICS